MRIAFLGTPEFALPSLEMLVMEGHTVSVFTQPDKPVGRKGVLTPPPVKVFADAHSLPVYQPGKIRGPEGVTALLEAAPELMVTAAFGQILSKENLSVPKHGCINVHGSLLPKYRGAAPIQWAIIHGEPVTGITTMLTDVGLDTGDILLQREISIKPNETAGELYVRMAALGAETLKETLALLQAGELKRNPQQEALVTKCAMLCKEDGKLDFHERAEVVHNRVRGTNPWPGAYALLDEAPLKIWRTAKAGMPPKTKLPLGTCYGDAKQGLFVACAEGTAIEVLELQAPGGKRMKAKDYLRGHPLAGKVLQ